MSLSRLANVFFTALPLLVTVFITLGKRSEDVLISDYSKRHQDVPIQGVSLVFQTSGRRKVNVLEVSNLYRFLGVGHVFKTC